MGKLVITIDDSLLEQSIYQEVFEIVVKENFDCSSCESTARCTVDSISPDELNVLCYASGYVACKLLERYEKKHRDVVEQYVMCLGEMAVEGEGANLLAYTKC